MDVYHYNNKEITSMSSDEFGDVSVNVLSSRAQLVAYLAELNHEAVLSLQI